MRKLKKTLGVVTLALLCFGCGASSNDQGVSFTLTGFEDPADATPIFGKEVPLSTDQEPSDGADGSVFVTWVFQNNIARQGLRTQRALMSYYIEGGDIQPPSTSLPMGLVLGPADPTGTDGSLPPGFDISNKGKANQFIVPPDIMEFINLNRNHFPEPPFTMNVIATVVGITTAGDQLETNELNFFVQFVPDQVIAPTPGDGAAGASTDGATVDTPTDTSTSGTDGSGDAAL